MALTYTPQDVQSGFQSESSLDQNFTDIQTALADGLSRSGSAPNAMSATLDMNSNRIINLPAPQSNSDAARYADVLGGITTTDAILPTQSGNTQRFLSTDGTNWVFKDIIDDETLYQSPVTGTVDRTLLSRLQDRYSVMDFGAVGDGVADDTAAVLACIAASGVAYFPRGTYNISSLSLSTSALLFGESAELVTLRPTSSTGSLSFISTTASGLGIRDLTIDLLNTDNTIANGFISGRKAISCVGTSGSYLTGINISDVRIKNCGESGVYLKWTDQVYLSDIEITRCGRYGFEVLSSRRVKVINPFIRDIFPGSGGSAPYLNAYGLTFTNLTAEQPCEDCEVINGYAEDVTGWEGFDTHYGRRIRFINCSTKNCGQGIVVQSDFSGLESSDITIIGGTHLGYGTSYLRDSTSFDTGAAITANMGTSSSNGTGLIIRDTISNGMGSGKNSSDGAITISNCDTYSISGNVISNAFKRGIASIGTCINGVISNNTIKTVTSVGSLSAGIETSNQTTAVISGNFVTGTVNEPYKILIPASSSYSILFGQDNLETVTNNTQAISAPGAISVNPYYYQVDVTTSGSQTLTLADGFEGQRKVITMVVDGGDGTLTPTNFTNGTSIVFNDVGDTIELIFSSGAWRIISAYGVSVI